MKRKEKTKKKRHILKNQYRSFRKYSEEFFQKSFFSMFEVLILIVIAILFGILIGYLVTNHHNPNDKNIAEIVDTYNNILDNYYEDVDSKELSDAAIKGMVQSLKDPYSNFMDEDNTNQFMEDVEGSFVGIGVTVLYEEEGYHRVIEVLEDGPAEKAGVQADDVIIEVDGKSVLNVSGDDFTNLVRGKRGTEVIITVRRGEEEKEITIKRDVVEIKNVSSKTFDSEVGKIGYIRIESFSANTYSQFSKNLKKLEKGGIKSLVIDVRDNPGGYLLQTQEILSLFLPRKTLLYQIESKNSKKKIYSSSKESRSYPIAVIVNNGSASASEILASTIQDVYSNGIVVGQQSYGKGSVQKPKYLKNGSSIRYTTQKWLTAKGKSIEGKGIKPDVIVEQSNEYYENPSDDTDFQLQEAINKLKESMQ